MAVVAKISQCPLHAMNALLDRHLRQPDEYASIQTGDLDRNIRGGLGLQRR
jgi:hypothetical protein